MDDEQRRSAKKQMMELMQVGRSRQEPGFTMLVSETSRSTAYRWWQAYRRQGEVALMDGRHGHPFKAREPVLNFLKIRMEPGTTDQE